MAFSSRVLIGTGSWIILVKAKILLSKSGQVLLKAATGIPIGLMSQDADGAFVSAFGENPKPFLVARTFADRQDFWVGRWIHAVLIEAQEVGPHELYTLRERVELVVSMVKVVDDADVLGVGLVSQPI